MPERLLAILASILTIALTAEGQADKEYRLPPEMRWHTQLVAKDETLLYTITKINRFSEEQDEVLWLIHDEDYGDLVIRHTMSYEHQLSTHRMHDLEDRAFLQQTLDLQLGAKTRRELLALGRNPETIVWPKAILKFETNGGRWERHEDDLKEPTRLRPLRREVRSSMSPFLLEALERMRGTLLGTQIEFNTMVLMKVALYDFDEEMKAPAGVQLKDAAPDCDFDDSFGYPCTKSQLARIEKAKKDGKTLTAYW